jgi:hypothetical protein
MRWGAAHETTADSLITQWSTDHTNDFIASGAPWLANSMTSAARRPRRTADNDPTPVARAARCVPPAGSRSAGYPIGTAQVSRSAPGHPRLELRELAHSLNQPTLVTMGAKKRPPNRARPFGHASSERRSDQNSCEPDHRDELADAREQAADHRDELADAREQAADHCEKRADEREQQANEREQRLVSGNGMFLTSGSGCGPAASESLAR